jgi:Arc/MetJ family transcription regulator
MTRLSHTATARTPATLYILVWHDVCMKRTTIEIDEELLARAKRALRQDTTRATVEEALRQAADRAESAHAERAARQRRYLEGLSSGADLAVLTSEEMWR